jgi:hypothetical protein
VTSHSKHDPGQKSFGDSCGGTSTSHNLPAANSFINMFEPHVCPWLAESFGVTGAMDNAWYLFGPADDIAATRIAYLNGASGPTVETVVLPRTFSGLSGDASSISAYACWSQRGPL